MNTNLNIPIELGIRKNDDALNSVYALVDCNNFYASCERVFNPKLENQPIVVLSNNDGCIVARSNEVKALKIGMGQPYFKFKDVIEKNNVRVFSSNYTLYGDMSRRVMSTLAQFAPEFEIYSIDEAFLNLKGCDRVDGFKNLTEYARQIRTAVLKWTGIPVSIGIGRTKTLSKLANHLAKKSAKTGGVLDLVDSPYIDRALEQVAVWDIWGVGRKHGKRLIDKGITNTRQLRDADDRLIRKQMGVVGMRLVYELRGISCQRLETIAPKRKGVVSSRSFGRKVTDLNELRESVSAHVANVAERIRKQKLATRMLTIFVLTNPHSKQDEQYSNSLTIKLPHGTSNTAELIHYAMHGVDKIFRDGYKYKKAGVKLDDLIPDDQIQATLFDNTDDLKNRKIMKTLDMLNDKLGSGTLTYASQGTTRPWKMKCEKRTPKYTTDWNQLLEVK